MATDQLPALPVGEAEVVWHDPATDPFPPKAGKIIDASLAFFDTAQIGDRLFTREQAEAIQREAFEAGKRAAIAADRARAVPRMGLLESYREFKASQQAPEQPADLSGQAATAAGEREAFEAHMSDGGKWPKAVERNSRGEYLLASAASGWSTWQAAWAAARASLSTPASGEGWKLVDVDGQPPCNGVSVFIGINSAGYVGAFNHVRQDGMCMMRSPEGSTVVMSVLKWWRRCPPAPTSPTEPAAEGGAA